MKVVKNGETIFIGKPMDERLYEGELWPFLKDSMLSHGDRIALVNPYTREELSYVKVVSLVERLARGLIKLGLREGTSLTFVAPNSIEIALLILATMASGAVVHAINPASMAGEVKRQLVLTDAVIVATTPELLPLIKEAVSDIDVKIFLLGPRDGNLTYDDLFILGTEDVTLPTTFGDPKVTISTLLFSSGTTGVPKGVQMTQRNILAFIKCFQTFDNATTTTTPSSHTDSNGVMIGPEDIQLLFLPLFHGYGQLIGLLNSLAYGSKLVIMSRFAMQDFLSFAERYKVTVLLLVPPVIVALANYPNLDKYDLSNLRKVFSGAAPLGREMEEKFLKRIRLPFMLQGYGMTECQSITLCSQNNFKPASCGRVMSATEIKVVDPETGKSLGENEVGELYVRSPLVTTGYYKNPEATRDTINSEGWLQTGDMAKVDSDGFFFIVDRRKELIKFKAEQVAPAVLDLLLGHPAVADVCVIGRPDTEAGELPMACVVKAAGRDALTEQEVKDFVAKNVPSYMRLRGGVQFRKNIPKSPSGKILRRLLRDELQQQMKSKL